MDDDDEWKVSILSANDMGRITILWNLGNVISPFIRLRTTQKLYREATQSTFVIKFHRWNTLPTPAYW